MLSNNENPYLTIGEAKLTMTALSDDYHNVETANDARAKIGWLALQSYTESAYGNPSAESVEQSLIDLLGDLQHTCKHFNLEFNGLLDRATRTFEEELIRPIG